ncbi:MAG: DNA polymerase III subunit gamma/tau [Acidimicrobiales bacterium]|nr:DNA polymerase III subunit gamma/tau [Acidimicrobiales bacterium]
MSYTSLYRRYRPQRFDQLLGQEHVVLALKNAVRDERVGHAYLFSGPRGTGKTSTARILAKALNCTDLRDGEPCGVCDSCVAITDGTSPDVFELDAASNNSVEGIRDLSARASLGNPGRTKVYVLDEVHMLSKPASNALLKTLEEPPPHVVFVLATTDPQKVLPTIRSRTQHLEFRLLPAEVLADHVRHVAADAGLGLPPDAVDWVVTAGAGSARDTLSALDRVVAAGGLPDQGAPLDELVEALAEADTAAALAAVARATAAGRDARTLTEALVGHLRDVFLMALAPEVVELPDRQRSQAAEQARRLTPATTVRALEVLGQVLLEIRHAPDPRVLLDVALVRLTRPDADTSPGALLQRIERLERAQAGGGAPPPAPRAGAPAGKAPTAEAPAAEVAPRPGPAEPAAPAASGVSQARAALGAHRRAPSPPAPTPTPTPATPAAARPTPTPTPTPTRAPVPDPAAGEPSRDELTLAWADTVLPGLPPRIKALYSAGRFVETTTGVAFALPNAIHCQKAEAYRAEVATTLGARFGRPVGLRLVVDDGTTAAPADASSRADAPPPIDDEAVDPDELVDAPADAAPRSGVERLTQAFPGAELVDDA